MQSDVPWASFVNPVSGWQWKDAKLWQDPALYKHSKSKENDRSSGLGSFIVENIYGRQNKTKAVRQAIRQCISELKPGEFGLNFGAGKSRIAPTILNLDLVPGPNVDLISTGTLDTPFQTQSLSLIICQEVLEHVSRPDLAIAEFSRILKPGGTLLLQLPFIIGYHPGPKDYWRFSTEAYAELLGSKNWKILEKNITVGHGSALHRILTEFVAVHFSVFGTPIYRLTKGLAALLFSPLVLFDVLTPFLPEKDRIPGGYIVKAERLS
jgi:SAM-dependent methyltransferase